MYKAEILADSMSPQKDRLTTMKITYPRIIHSELMTHRMFSRNSASSRAVPVQKMIESVKNNMFTPLAVQKTHKSMQGSEYFEGEQFKQAKQLWVESAELALQQAEKMKEFGITKQLINRILEPYQYYQVLVTATEWENFFELRCPQYEFVYNDETPSKIFRSKKDCSNWYKDEFSTEDNPYNTDLDWLQINKSQAEIHIQAIAELMYDAYNESTPKELKAGEWHIPFGDNIDLINWLDIVNNDGHLDGNLDLQDSLFEQDKVKIATARCARVSYTVVGEEGKAANYENDIKLHNRLAQSGHWSPFEHVARAMSEEEYSYFYVSDGPNPEDFHAGWCRNFKGFIQYRHLIEDNYE